jgi:hypothetical protein
MTDHVFNIMVAVVAVVMLAVAMLVMMVMLAMSVLVVVMVMGIFFLSVNRNFNVCSCYSAFYGRFGSYTHIGNANAVQPLQKILRIVMQFQQRRH